MAASNAPLGGIKVLDFTQLEFGPAATLVLADAGADVIKIEKPEVGDLSRSTDPYASSINESAYFISLNRNKRSAVLDLQNPEDRGVVRELVKNVDVLVENFRPGVAERLGIGFADSIALNPRLIYASGSGFGSSGPLGRHPGQDLLAQSLSGAAIRNSGADGSPLLYPTAIADFAGGMVLAQGILIALLQRDKTGVGQHVQTSLFATMMAMQMQEATQWLMRGQSVNWIDQNVVRPFRTQDGWITVVGALQPNPLGILCHALGIDDLSADHRFATFRLQVENRDELWPPLDEAFATLTTDGAVQRLEKVDILCSPVLDMGEALEHPQTTACSLLGSVSHSDHGSVTTILSPISLSHHEPARDPAPSLGEHTRDVLEEFGIKRRVVLS